MEHKWHSPTDVDHQPLPDFSACDECRKPLIEPRKQRRDEYRKRFRAKEAVILRVHWMQMLKVNSIMVEPLTWHESKQR